MKRKYLSLRDFFISYVNQFEMDDSEDQENIDLKIRHSYRVCEEMENIIEDFELSGDEFYLAKIIALFHDIGRFKQYKEYKTFSDYKSEDHGELGVQVLEENGLMADFSPEHQKIVISAIRLHNNPELPDDNELFFAKLIRDADKLDIFNLFKEKYEKENEETELIKLDHRPEISDHIYEKLKNKKLIKYDNLETVNDLKLMQMTWIYDINFSKTLEIIKERKYIETIYNSMPDNKRAKEIYEMVTNEFENRIKAN
ncbi:MAG: HD domain-containing protein [Bacillota bacterium]